MTFIGIRVILVAWLIRLTAIIAPGTERLHFVRAIGPYLEGASARAGARQQAIQDEMRRNAP